MGELTGLEWSGLDTPNTVITTRAPAVPFEEHPVMQRVKDSTVSASGGGTSKHIIQGVILQIYWALCTTTTTFLK